MGEIIDVTTETFSSDVLQSELPVVVDFWADWCEPCKALSPILRELAGEMGGKLKFAKVDVDAQPDLAGQFGIQGIPTLIYFRGGAPVDQKVGLESKELLRRSLHRLAGGE